MLLLAWGPFAECGDQRMIQRIRSSSVCIYLYITCIHAYMHSSPCPHLVNQRFHQHGYGKQVALVQM